MYCLVVESVDKQNGMYCLVAESVDKQNVLSVCLQKVLSEWMNKTGRDGYTQSGTVCGQDPESVSPS